MNMIEVAKVDYEAAGAFFETAKARLAELDQPDKEVTRWEREIKLLDMKREEMVIKLGWAKEEAPRKILGKREKLRLEVASAERQLSLKEKSWHQVATKVKLEDGSFQYIV
jgi:hypothetical protein